MLLALFILLGAFFRLFELGRPSLGSDEINFLRLCAQKTTFVAFFEHWMEWMGITGQFPFSMAIIKGFLNVTGMTADAFAIRLPSAIWGVLAIPAAYLLGREIRGPDMGLLMAALLAVSPMHIQMSREAYYYVPLILGSFLMSTAAIAVLRTWLDGRALARWAVWSNALGFFLLTWSQPTGWPMAALLLGVEALALLRLWRRHGMRATVLAQWWIPVLMIGLPLLFADWGVPHLLKNASGSTKASALKALAVSEGSAGILLHRAVGVMFLGGTPPRFSLSLLLLLGGASHFALQWRRSRALLLVPLLPVAFAAVFLIARASTGAGFEVRYINALLPFGLALLAGAVLGAADLLKRSYVTVALGLPLVGAMVYPSWLSARLQGSPVPYRDIVAWCDARLAPGTPVLVDRWLEPWNELRSHVPTNAQFTFTTPNEPVEVFRQSRWRDGARDFLERFPDAAYLEITKQYWHVRDVGPWSWPREHFARQVGITNRAGLRLRELGLAVRSDFYWSTTNRVVTEIFYNTREDVMQRRAAAGVQTFAWYGPGWGYTKTQDYRDWRVLQKEAELQLINLTHTTLPLRVTVRAVAAGQGGKEVQTSSGVQGTFPGGQMRDWDWGRMELPPGITTVKLRDPAGRVPLLVEGVGFQPDGG